MNHKLSVFVVVALLAAPCWAQSGSRNSSNSGGSGSIAAPIQSFPSPASPSPKFAPDASEGIPLDSMPTPMVSDTASSDSFGIPAASLNDPIWAIHDPASSLVIDHGLWDYFLTKYVRNDRVGLSRVGYAKVSRADREILRQYVQMLKSSDPRILNRNEQLAYWLNLYNSQTVLLVLDHYPLRSIRQIKTNVTDLIGPFDDPIICVLGKCLSLTDIESGIMRPIWQDPRIHYALNCASYGCPNLLNRAWSSITLEQDLNSAACQFINSGRAFKTGPFGRVVIASKIFKWYQEDFGGTEKAVLNHMRQYANASTRRKLAGRSQISAYTYDWSLNDAKQNGPRLLEALRR